MSNVERLRIEQEDVNLLLNKFQRHRGDTLNSRMCPYNEKPNATPELTTHSYNLGSGDLSTGGYYRREASALVNYPPIRTLESTLPIHGFLSI